MWPRGCQANVQTMESWAVSMQPISLSVLKIELNYKQIFCRRNLNYPTFQNIIEPSDPPEQKSPSWTGCHDTALASFLCPRNTCTSSRKFLRSKSFKRWSLEAVISQLPLLFHFKSMTVDLWACLPGKHSFCREMLNQEQECFNTYNVAKDCPLFGSQSLIGCWLSLLPETISDFCGCQWTHLTSAPWPLNTRSS